MTTSGGEQNFTIQGAGTLTERATHGSMSMTVDGKTITEVIANPFVYVRLPGKTGAGSWAKVNINVFSEALGAGGSPFGGNSMNPTEMLKFLKAAGTVNDLGVEPVKGVPATHYHATIDLNRYASLVSPSRRASVARYVTAVERMTGANTLPMDVWVDAHRHVRRFALAMRLCTREGQLTEAVTMSLYDYARQPAVQIPPASQVTDVTDKIKASVANGLQQLKC